MNKEFNKHKKRDAIKWIVVFLAIILLAVSVAAAITRGFTTADPWGWLDKDSATAVGGEDEKPGTVVDGEKPGTSAPAEPQEPTEPAEPVNQPIDWSQVYEFSERFYENGDRHLTITGLKSNVWNGVLIEDYVIPAKIGDSSVGVGTGAFSGNSFIKTLVVEAGVDSLGDSAFSGCKNLETLTIGEPVSEHAPYGVYIFDNCEKLSRVEIKEGFTYLTRGFFAKCSSLKHLVLPASVKYVTLGDAFNGWDSTHTIYVRPGACDGLFDELSHCNAVIIRDYTGEIPD